MSCVLCFDTLDASELLSVPTMTTKNVSRNCQRSSGGGGVQPVPKPHLQTHNSMVRSWLAHHHSRKLKPALKLVAGPWLSGGVVRLLWLPTLPQWLVDAECIGTKGSLHVLHFYHICVYSAWERTRHIPKTPLRKVLDLFLGRGYSK